MQQYLSAGNRPPPAAGAGPVPASQSAAAQLRQVGILRSDMLHVYIIIIIPESISILVVFLETSCIVIIGSLLAL